MNQGFITRSFILVSIIFSINLYSCSSCSEENTSNNKFNETKEDESKESIFDANAVEDSLIICYGKENDNDDGGHEFVDLDLPSGISWQERFSIFRSFSASPISLQPTFQSLCHHSDLLLSLA